jgi:hypothetical protein
VQKIILRSFYFSLILSIPSIAIAQVRERCSTVPYMQMLRQEGNLIQTDEQFEQWLQKRKRERQQRVQTHRTKEGPYQIPVVVHVIHNGEEIGTGSNISEAQILSQIAVINYDYNRLNADASNTPAEFLPVAGSINIEFVMAKRDPSGLSTNGINRVQGTRTSWTFSNDAELKSLSFWPSEDYLNIWVTTLNGQDLGYAQFPVSTLEGLENYQNGLASRDGAVLDYRVFGTNDAGDFNLFEDYDKGRTVTHEIGHFLGLRHPWGDVNNCSGTDYVNDTPNQSSATFGCPDHPKISCGSNDMFQNYMDWTDDACMNLFTVGQIDRMEIILEDPAVPRRNSLLTSPGLLDPDCDVIDVALLGIKSPAPITCNESSNLQLEVRNRSCVTLTSIRVEYSINAGTFQSHTVFFDEPLSINGQTTLSIPSVNFQEGVNTLLLSLTHANELPDENPDNSLLTSFIHIDKTRDRIPLREKFDFLAWPTLNPPDGIGWQLASTNFGNSASVLAHGESSSVGTEAWLATPVLDFSQASKASMFFDLSYAYTGTHIDRLKIVASTDCGNTYPITLFNQAGSALSNTNTASSWLPTTPDHWQIGRYINLNALAGEKNARLAFVFTNASGNNLYLDNVEFFLSDDPSPVSLGAEEFTIYWHTNFEAAVTFNLEQRMPVRILVVDLLGRIFIDSTAPDILNQTFPVDLGQASTGIYIMRVQAGTKLYTRKFYLSR